MQFFKNMIIEQIEIAIELYKPILESLNEEQKKDYKSLKKCLKILKVKPKDKPVIQVVLNREIPLNTLAAFMVFLC